VFGKLVSIFIVNIECLYFTSYQILIKHLQIVLLSFKLLLILSAKLRYTMSSDGSHIGSVRNDQRTISTQQIVIDIENYVVSCLWFK
jgi:hypothetical protein